MGKHKKGTHAKDCGFIVYAAITIVIFFILSTAISYFIHLYSIVPTISSYILSSLIIIIISSIVAIKATRYHHDIPKNIRKFAILSAGTVTAIFLGSMLREALLFPVEQAQILLHEKHVLSHTVYLLLPIGYGIVTYITAIFHKKIK